MAIPVHVITGFLGAGKTTLLNRVLKSGAFANTAIIINEFGDVGIDHLLVESTSAGGQMIELSDGCLCCTVRGDLVDTLDRIADRARDGASVERIVIETTGLADPAPVLQAVMSAPGAERDFRVASVVTVVCAATGIDALDNHEEARSQAAIADAIVLTKTDLQEARPGELLERLSAMNPIAPVADANDAGFRFALDDSGMSSVYGAADRFAVSPHRHDHGHHHDVNRHDASIEAFTLTHDRPVDLADVGMFVDLLRSSLANELLRMKGIVWTVQQPDLPLVLHGVRSVFHPPEHLASWDGRTPETRLVVIARNGSRRRIADLFAAFTGRPAIDAPDRQALTDNPLAIPGT